MSIILIKLNSQCLFQINFINDNISISTLIIIIALTIIVRIENSDSKIVE